MGEAITTTEMSVFLAAGVLSLLAVGAYQLIQALFIRSAISVQEDMLRSGALDKNKQIDVLEKLNILQSADVVLRVINSVIVFHTLVLFGVTVPAMVLGVVLGNWIEGESLIRLCVAGLAGYFAVYLLVIRRTGFSIIRVMTRGFLDDADK